MMRVIEDRHRLPRDIAESPSLRRFKSCLDTILDNLTTVTRLQQEAGLHNAQNCLQLSRSVNVEFCCNGLNIHKQNLHFMSFVFGED